MGNDNPDSQRSNARLGRMPFIVVDQNVLRDAKALATFATRCETDGMQLLLPDSAVQEFAKSGLGASTAARSLQELVPYRGVVAASVKLSHAIANERRTGIPSETIESPRATGLLRALLTELHSGSDHMLRDLFEGSGAERMNASVTHWNDHQLFRSLTVAALSSIKSELTSDQLRDMRKCGTEAPTKWLRGEFGETFLDRPPSPQFQAAFAPPFRPSVTAAFVFAVAGLAVWWLAAGGVDCAKPERLTNDYYDVDGIVFGALSETFATADKRAKAVCDAVTAGIEARM